MVTIFAILVVTVSGRREHYLVLEEVLPGGRIVSREDGVVEYRDVYYILGTHDLHMRRKLLQALPPEVIEGPCIVDMRFHSQIIIKKGPVNERSWSGPDKLD